MSNFDNDSLQEASYEKLDQLRSNMKRQKLQEMPTSSHDPFFRPVSDLDRSLLSQSSLDRESITQTETPCGVSTRDDQGDGLFYQDEIVNNESSYSSSSSLNVGQRRKGRSIFGLAMTFGAIGMLSCMTSTGVDSSGSVAFNSGSQLAGAVTNGKIPSCSLKDSLDQESCYTEQTPISAS